MGKITTGVASISRFKLIPSKRQEFLDAHRSSIANAGDFIDKHANFFFFGFGRNENEWVSIESWKDEEVLNQLRASPAFKQTAKLMLDCLSAPAEISVYAGEDGPLTALDKFPVGLSKVHPQDAAMPVKYV
jgi:quinol monooxygenase YgiN